MGNKDKVKDAHVCLTNRAGLPVFVFSDGGPPPNVYPLIPHNDTADCLATTHSRPVFARRKQALV